MRPFFLLSASWALLTASAAGTTVPTDNRQRSVNDIRLLFQALLTTCAYHTRSYSVLNPRLIAVLKNEKNARVAAISS